ncbi:XRE family transcriptional regulator [Streptomyces cinnabarinus]|uniref:XRE family transcriptional regulator n=1 Tax=Streptomyces cinnabarinus TaxID=67287 RepID=A0ABY7KMC8_9ACTN|nr:XRE family transcriptional regulator [Streptomyces cinnabarinus]WAZ25712.1 XRE family transcriptional regulator [Streptomyces cinnabarinus]
MIDPLVERIATRIRDERERRRWTLAQLADASGVSRAMINRIERGESNPTAVVLGKLSAAFRLSVASLLAEGEAHPEAETPAGVRRRAEDVEWTDPGTGYRRRQITGPRFPAEIAEIQLPPGARVPYPAAAFAFLHQLVWVLEGRLTFQDGDTVHDLGPGDIVELGEPAPRVFTNTGTDACRYAVVLSRTDRP